MGNYAQDEDLDEYEDDFIDDQDGDVGPRKYADEEFEDEDEEDEYEEEEVEVERVSEDTLKLLKYRQKLKEQLRRKENGGGLSKSLDRGRRPPINNFGSFFGPSQPVIADRVFQESKALLETRHLAPKASTSQSQTNGKKVNFPSISGPKNVVSRPPHASQVKSKVQIIKQTRDYSFLLSDDADVSKSHRDPGLPKNSALKHDARPAQGPAQSNMPSGYSDRKVVNVYEQKKQHGTFQGSTHTAPLQKLTSDNRASVVSSDSSRQLDLRKPSQPTKKLGTYSESASVRPPAARALPSNPSSSTDRRMPSSSTDRRMPSSSTDRRMPPSSTDRRMPPSSTDRRMPPSSTDRRMPPSSTDRRMAPSSTDRRMPPSSTERRMAPSSTERRMAPSSTDRRMSPPSTDRRMAPPSTDRRMAPSSTDRRMAPSSTDRRMAPSSTDRKMTVGIKPPVTSVSNRSLPNGQRLPVEKSRAPGGMRPQDRDRSAQYSKDNRVLNKENIATSQMKPPKQSSFRANVDRDRTRVQKPNGELRVNSQSGAVKKVLNSRKRQAEDDDDVDISSMIRKMFGYDKNKYVDNDDDDMCMEADFRTVQEEERRSARIARQEDEEELEKIMEEERQEMLRKKAKRRKMSQS